MAQDKTNYDGAGMPKPPTQVAVGLAMLAAIAHAAGPAVGIPPIFGDEPTDADKMPEGFGTPFRGGKKGLFPGETFRVRHVAPVGANPTINLLGFAMVEILDANGSVRETYPGAELKVFNLEEYGKKYYAFTFRGECLVRTCICCAEPFWLEALAAFTTATEAQGYVTLWYLGDSFEAEQVQAKQLEGFPGEYFLAKYQDVEGILGENLFETEADLCDYAISMLIDCQTEIANGIGYFAMRAGELLGKQDSTTRVNALRAALNVLAKSPKVPAPASLFASVALANDGLLADAQDS